MQPELHSSHAATKRPGPAQTALAPARSMDNYKATMNFPRPSRMGTATNR